MRNHKVRKHIRKTKKGTCVVSAHKRGRYGKRPKNDKYDKRPNSKMPMDWLLKQQKIYSTEWNGLVSGKLVASQRHKAFILRRLKAANRSIVKKRKTLKQ